MWPDNESQYSVKELSRLRGCAGRRLRELREKAGLSQRDLAARLDMAFYTYVSTIEHGRSKVSVQQYHAWAAALEVDVKDLVLTLMPYYDPITYRLLYGEEAWKEAVGAGVSSPKDASAIESALASAS